MTSTLKTNSMGQVAFARCTFWQLHQINLFLSLCVKSTSSLILVWKGCNYPLLMKTAAYQTRFQGAKWTWWIWITPDAWLRPLSSPRCTHGCARTDEPPPLAWLLPFFHGRWVWADRSQTHSHKPLRELQRQITSSSSERAAASPSPFRAAPRNCLSVSALPSPPQAGDAQSPPLDKVQLVCCSSVTLWDQGRVKKNPGAPRNKKLKQNSAFCSITLPVKSLNTLLFFNLLM